MFQNLVRVVSEYQRVEVYERYARFRYAACRVEAPPYFEAPREISAREQDSRWQDTRVSLPHHFPPVGESEDGCTYFLARRFCTRASILLQNFFQSAFERIVAP